jgi:hypothetical protein
VAGFQQHHLHRSSFRRYEITFFSIFHQIEKWAKF